MIRVNRAFFSGLLAISIAGCGAKSLSGPLPAATGIGKRTTDENPTTAWQKAPTPVTVSGKNFAPVVINTLAGERGVKIPQLFLVNATSSTALTKVVWVDRQTMRAEIPVSVPLGSGNDWEDFKVQAVDPAGGKGKPGGTFRISSFEPPKVLSTQYAGSDALIRFCDTNTVSPVAFTLVLSGTSFHIGQAVYSSGFGASAEPAALTLVAASDTTAAVSVPPGLAAGTYDIRVINTDGQINTFKNAFKVEFYSCPPPTGVITSVSPRFIYRGEDALLQINGSGFAATPALSIAKNNYAADVSYEVWLSSGSVQGFLARDNTRPIGWYQMNMENPGDSTTVTLAAALLIIDQPVPRIVSVTPDSAETDSVITIRGTGFPSDATVDVYYKDATGGTHFFTSVTSAAYSTVVTATVPYGTIGIDNVLGFRALILRVYKNTAFGTVWGEYSSLVVIQNSGNTGIVLSASSSLTQPRTQFGLAGGSDGVGSRYLYAAGGRNAYSGSDVTAMTATVELASINLFGELGSFYANPTTLGVPAYGLGLVQLDGWLYATGGTVPSGKSAAVRKAKILDPADAPVIASSIAGAGLLAGGNWIYRVSAVMDSDDWANPSGESLPSQLVAVSSADAGGVSLTWKPVANAVSYRIYRTPNANGFPAQAVRIGSVACCSFSDSGSGAVGSEKPLPAGALSVWTVAGTLTTARAFHGTAIARDATGTPYLYVLGGQDVSEAYLGNYEYSSALTGGANLTFTQVASADFARAHAALSVATKEAVVAANRPTGADWMVYYSGCNGADKPVGSGGVSGEGSALAEVQAGGALLMKTPVNSIDPLAGTGILFANNQLFQFGGSQGNTACINPNPISGIDSGDLGAYTFSQPNANGGNSLIDERAYFGYTRFNGQVFLVGGVTGTGASRQVANSIEYIFY